MPGQALVVDPDRMLIVDVLPWEDAHDQERAFLEQIVPKVRLQDLWIDLRRFRKHRRGPKKPPPKKRSGAKTHPVATARILLGTSP